MIRHKKRQRRLLIITLLLCGLVIGYSLLTKEVKVVGINRIKGHEWSIHFDGIHVRTRESVTLSEGDVAPVIDPTTKTRVDCTVSLNEPGDAYSFTVDVVNDGTIDGMVDSVLLKKNNSIIDSNNALPYYLDFTVTYDDGSEIHKNHLLKSGDSDTYLVTVVYKRDIEVSDLLNTVQNLSLSFEVVYVQAENDKAIQRTLPEPVSFENDSWKTIARAAQSGNTSAYHVGDTKTIELGNNLGTHTIRIANMSTPSECETVGFSQTACGFVLEFADIATTKVLNSYYTNVGGWEQSEIREYLNSKTDSMSFYNSLPITLKTAIVDTDIVSGHGSTAEETNSLVADKIYLLSTHEIWKDVDGNVNYGIDHYDSAYNDTRQLDYYENLGVTTSNYSEVQKKYNDATNYWWLRSPYLTNTTSFYYATYYGSSSSTNAYYTYGISPAFRLSGPESTVLPTCRSFENDSWEEIVSNAQSNNYYKYAVGCTKEITLENGFGKHIVRVVNNSIPEVCSTNGFSQTACGFVLEFADIINNYNMNSTSTNIGGWLSSDLRSELNSTEKSTSIFNSLPDVIKDAIINTNVISSHGSSPDEINFSSEDKLYLLSTYEIWKDTDRNAYGGIDYYDSSYGNTRQLDYYEKYGITTSNSSSRTIKRYNNNTSYWWLRSSYKGNMTSFFETTSSGGWTNASASTSVGVSPAFRLAGPSSTYLPPCYAFENDSWETIVESVQSIDRYKYPVGCTKEITLGNGLGTHTLRVANNTNYNCTLGSQTACGFVLEFTDIIANTKFNATRTNMDGWSLSPIRSYLNAENDSTSIFNSIPTVIKNSIINTTVVSGHGSSSGDTNLTTVDKLYLLSLPEVYGEANNSTSVSSSDTAYTSTRQLDYYKSKGVTSSSTSYAIKKFNNYNNYWWLRTPYKSNTTSYYVVTTSSSGFSYSNSDNSYGVSPAFRLAGPASTYVSPCEAFENDSLESIVSNVQSGNYGRYPVGCTREITLGNDLGTHTLRVANNSNYNCNYASKTACGFVIEFADIITKHRMNPDNNLNGIGVGEMGTGTVGSWPACEMRTYLNNTEDSTSIINSLPTVLKNAIIDTTVVTGNPVKGNNTNYTSTDKLYLLSPHEVLEDDDYNNNEGINDWDTAYSSTRQLDYYKNNGVTVLSHPRSSKKYNGSNDVWWLRAPINTYYPKYFFLIGSSGGWSNQNSGGLNGVSPAFRLK